MRGAGPRMTRILGGNLSEAAPVGGATHTPRTFRDRCGVLGGYDWL